MKKTLAGVLLGLVGMIACKRDENTYNSTDPRLETNRFCNDPEAVNYNWSFPGKADSTTCVYPSDLFKGRFLFKDSVYDTDGYLDSAASQKEYYLNIFTAGKSRVGIEGFCTSTLRLTAPRTGFRANLDTDAIVGQIFCRPQDTISGFLIRDYADSTQLQINFTVYADTSIRTHRGTAYRR